MASSYFVFIVTSRDRPEYEIFDSMRRKQMASRKIPHLFLLNGTLPDGYTLQGDELYYSDPSFTPGMFWKFYWALQQTDSIKNVDYIIRLNSSTFVDFDRFEEIVLPILPPQRCFAGPIFDFDCEDGTVYSIISGTAMIFSKDVIQMLLNTVLDSELFKLIIQDNPDDVAISQILQVDGKYRLFELGQHFAHYENDQPADNETEATVFYRIKNTDRMTTDVELWKQLTHSE